MGRRIKPVGDQAVLVELGDQIDERVNRRVMRLSRIIQEARLPGVVELIPAFTSLLVCYDALVTDFQELSEVIGRLEDSLEDGSSEKKDFGNASCGSAGPAESRLVRIPVCYGGVHGPDLRFVAQHAGLTEKEVIQIHCRRDYRIYMLGFLPGFPYLGGLDERIFTPRLSSPRTKIPAGSVGIGGEQTGIYPMDSPGGWQLIGQTPLKLFDPDHGEHGLYEAGDTIRFVPVSEEIYKRIAGNPECWKLYENDEHTESAHVTGDMCGTR